MLLVSHLHEGAKISTSIDGKFSIDNDQPPPFGADSAPAPFDVFLVGVSACAAYFAQAYCRKWKLSHEGISVELEPLFTPQHKLAEVKLRLKVPESFPAEHIAGLERNAAACPVKKALENPPAISMETIRI